MSAIDEGIVREYFEQNGFLVRQARKYQVSSRRKLAEEEIDLVVCNPAWKRTERRSPAQLDAAFAAAPDPLSTASTELDRGQR